MGRVLKSRRLAWKGRALRALLALLLSWGGQISDLWLHLLPRAGFSAESPMVLPRVGCGNGT